MDPTANAREQWDVIRAAEQGRADGPIPPALREQLRELRHALDEWRTRGGFAPEIAPPTVEQCERAFAAPAEPEQNVYVVMPHGSDDEPAVFLRERDADAFEATYGEAAGSFRLLTANADTARAMIAERIDEDQRREFFRGYVTCALWADLMRPGVEETGSEPGAYDEDCLDGASDDRVRETCEAFIEANAPALAVYALEILDRHATTNPWEMAGHDLWLTRNGHGAGYWDREVSVGDELAAAARALGEANNPTLNDDDTVTF